MGSLGPGPAYLLPSTIGYDNHDVRKQRSPQYSIAGRLKKRNIDITPGPGLNTNGFTRYGRATSLAYTMAPRKFIKDFKKTGPGPANYDISKYPYVSVTAPPSYSLGSRHQNYRVKNQPPGPNAYVIKDSIVKTAAPGYSMGIKTMLKNSSCSPGPANYAAGNLNVTMPRAPEYSLFGRIKFDRKPFGPGANAYNRTNYKPGKSPPAYSFGTRHSLKAPPLIVPCDNF